MKILRSRHNQLPLTCFVVSLALWAATVVDAQSGCENNAVVCFGEVVSEPAQLPVPPEQQELPDENAVVAQDSKPASPPLQVSTETYTEEQKTLADGITADLNARRLQRPEGNNALEKIRKLKVLLPTHDYAVNGERYIARVYMVLGRAAVKSGQTDLARQRLNSALKIDSGVAGQAQLREAISKLESASSSDAVKPVIRNYGAAVDTVASRPRAVVAGKKMALAAPMMVAIPAGKFVMGSESGAEDEKPMREVSVEAFSMSKYEITVEQYQIYAIDHNIPAPQYDGQDRNLPVTNVSWLDAQAYVQWLTRRTKKHYRLPTEAEWEYAARAGTVTPFFTGDDLRDANCVGCGSDNGGVSALGVGSFPPNPFGLYDMHGNVWEWVQDCWTDNYFGRGDNAAAIVRKSCERHVMRGGAWYNQPDFARSSYRANEVPVFRDKGVGFRVVHDGL